METGKAVKEKVSHPYYVKGDIHTDYKPGAMIIDGDFKVWEIKGAEFWGGFWHLDMVAVTEGDSNG